ncbi:MAG TPA: response regulator transcription factor [Bacteroidota bacterium]|jgi:DNA-binding NarL/FixJ family response regulator|nr:response regulator transcription factor [Bacteroidota bacterium]
MIRIFLIDDHIIFREGLKQILAKHSDLRVVAEAGNSKEVMEKIQKDKYDVIVLDISLPGRNGPELLQDIKKILPQVAVLVLSMYPEDQYAVRMIKAGASGYVTKESAPEELINAIRKVAQGRRYISSKLAEEMAVAIGDNTPEFPHQLLSNREYQVMRMLASGKTLKDIAEELMISEKTVTTYRARILEKMHLKNNVELTIYAITHRLLPWYYSVRNQNQSHQE